MEKIDTNYRKVIDKIKSQTGSNPDIVFKESKINDTNIAVIFSESLTDRTTINDYILEFLENLRLTAQKTPDLFTYIKENITAHKIISIKSYKDLFYNLLVGYTLIVINGSDEIISIETKAKLDSGVMAAQNETVTKGPKDAFTENYQINIGLIRKRIKSETLWCDEYTIGSKSKNKVGILYMKDIASTKLVEAISEKIKQINVDGIFDSNYIIETISGNKRSVFPNYISTERPDLVSLHLLDGRIAIVVENTPYVVVIPALFIDFFHSPEDLYQKVLNVNVTRIIRFIAFLITVLAPGIYVAISTYNLEAIPTKLLISFSSQRAGVPLPIILETIMMMVTFEILKETDTRAPSAIGSSLSIVGALVLGQAAVTAGIVSPITVIIVAITSISGLISYSVDIVNGVRWWRLIFLLFAAAAGTYGVMIAGLFFTISIGSIKSFGLPYLAPFAPFYKDNQTDSILISNARKFTKRNPLTAKGHVERQENKDEAL
jgi:spore germination protein KA